MLRILVVFGVLTATGSSAQAQVFEVVGGNSSLYQAGGGSVYIHASSYEFSVGAGMIGGKFQAGGQISKIIGNSKYILGDNQIDFHLPTDIFDASHYLFGRGLGVKTVLYRTDTFAFAGTETTMYDSPLFSGSKSGREIAFLSLHKVISPNWQVFSDTAISNCQTEIAAMQWEPAPQFDLAFAGGIGANQPYAAGSLNISRRHVNVLGSYIQAGEQFHRIIVPSPVFAEPDKGNLAVTLRPSGWWSLSGGMQHFLVPLYPSGENVSSSVDQAGTTLQVFGIQMNAGLYHSSFQGESNHAATFTASRDVTAGFRIMGSYLASRPKGSNATNSFLATLSETLNPHISVNQIVNISNGQTNVMFGGTLLTNLVTVSANYETFYVPAQNANPFQQSLVLDLGLRLFGRLRLHGASFVNPTGKMLYTADADGIVARGESNMRDGEPIAIDPSILQGQVLDVTDHPVEGAALFIDGKCIFTDSEGRFFLRERKSQSHRLTVATSQFLAAGQWQVVSAPSNIRSSRGQTGPGAVIIVRQEREVVRNILENSVEHIGALP